MKVKKKKSNITREGEASLQQFPKVLGPPTQATRKRMGDLV